MGKHVYIPKVGLCNLHAICVSVNTPTLLTFESLNQSLRNLVRIAWQQVRVTDLPSP
jgi:hypothetical protein